MVFVDLIIMLDAQLENINIVPAELGVTIKNNCLYLKLNGASHKDAYKRNKQMK